MYIYIYRTKEVNSANTGTICKQKHAWDLDVFHSQPRMLAVYMRTCTQTRIHFLHSAIPCARHYTSNVQRRSLSNQDRYYKKIVGQKTLKTTLPRLLLMVCECFPSRGHSFRTSRGKRHNLCLLPPGCAETAHPESPGRRNQEIFLEYASKGRARFCRYLA